MALQLLYGGCIGCKWNGSTVFDDEKVGDEYSATKELRRQHATAVPRCAGGNHVYGRNREVVEIATGTRDGRIWGECHEHIFSYEPGADPQCRACLQERLEQIQFDHSHGCEYDEEACGCDAAYRELKATLESLKGDWRLESTVSEEMAAMNQDD
ncbi:MAG TPA: hypothetical protein VJJ22_04590 [Candidatus Paceibacterota bacterium]